MYNSKWNNKTMWIKMTWTWVFKITINWIKLCQFTCLLLFSCVFGCCFVVRVVGGKIFEVTENFSESRKIARIMMKVHAFQKMTVFLICFVVFYIDWTEFIILWDKTDKNGDMHKHDCDWYWWREWNFKWWGKKLCVLFKKFGSYEYYTTNLCWKV